MLILSYENEFNLHVKEISFSYERIGTKTRFEEEAKGNSEMAYWLAKTYKIQLAVIIFAVVFIRTLYNIFRVSFTKKKGTEICTTFFHLTSKFKCIFNIHTGNSYIHKQMIVLAIFSLSASDL